MPITVTPDNSIAVMEIHIDYIAPAGTQTSADLYRGLSASGPWTLLRSVDLLGQEAYQFDNTMPLNTAVFYRTVANDGTELISASATITTGPGGAYWLRDPGRPWADIEMLTCDTPDAPCDFADRLAWVGFTGFNRATDASLIEVLNSEKPADVFARRKNLATEISFFSNTLVLKLRVYELFTAGGPLLLQLPPVYGWDDEFIQTTADLAEEYIAPDQRKPWRRWTAPVRTVDRPLGPVQGTGCANWCAVNTNYPSYAALTATLDTWADVASGTTGCP